MGAVMLNSCSLCDNKVTNTLYIFITPIINYDYDSKYCFFKNLFLIDYLFSHSNKYQLTPEPVDFDLMG